MRPHSPPAESHSFVGMARETAAMPPAGPLYKWMEEPSMN